VTRDELEGLGMSDRELEDAYLQVAAERFDSRVQIERLRGPDSPELQLARRDMYEEVMTAWYRDPGLP